MEGAQREKSVRVMHVELIGRNSGKYSKKISLILK